MLPEELRSGKAVAKGSFRLDEKRARQKLRNFQLPNPHHYILQFIKAAHVLGASSIRCSIDVNELEMTFDGLELGATDLEDLYSAAFSQRTDQRQLALRFLAIGANAAQAIGLSEFVIEVGGDQGHGIKVGEDAVTSTSRAPSVDVGTRIYLRKRVHPKLLLRFVDKLRGQLPEARLLRDSCAFASVPIAIDGVEISKGLTLPEDVHRPQRFEHDGERGIVGVSLKEHHLITDVLQYGVLIDRNARLAPFGEFGARAVVESPHLTTDLSHSAFVSDEAWTALRQRVDKTAVVSLLSMLRQFEPSQIIERRRELRSVILELFLNINAWSTSFEIVEDVVDTLEKLPVFEWVAGAPDKAGRFGSLACARTDDEGESTIRFSRKRFEPVAGFEDQGRVLLMPFDSAHSSTHQLDARRLLQYFADEVIDVTAGLERLQERDNNRRRWQLRPPNQGHPELRNKVRRTSGALAVVVGLRDTDAGTGARNTAVIRYTKEGRRLSQESIESVAPEIFIEISGDLEPNELFDGPARNEELRQAHVELTHLLIDQLKAMPFSLDVLGALLGQLQEELSQVFGWTKEDWAEFEETLFGIAPTLRGSIENLSIEETIGLCLNRLGVLADRPVATGLDGQEYSLRQIHHYLFEESMTGQAWMVDAAPRRPAPDDDDSPLVLIVDPSQQWVMRVFFFDYVAERVIEHHGRSPETSKTSKENPEIDDELREREMELLSRLAAEDRGDGKPRSKPSPTTSLETSSAVESAVADAIKPPPGLDSEEHLPDSAQKESNFERHFADHLVEQIRRHCAPDLRARFDDIDDYEIIDDCGTRPVYVLGSGDRIVLDRAHPAVAEAYNDRTDAVAGAFASLAIYSAVTRYDIEHGVDQTPRQEVVARKQRFLRGISEML